jgi:cytoskeleton protein RodZ
MTPQLDIGSALKDARRRIGMDVKEAEERTKIRAKYLRALEAEDWEVLPAPAYVRGFLRTYGALLGLDGEHLADEFRRRYEAPGATVSPASEAVLQERRRAGGARPPSRGPLIAAVAVGIVALLLLLSLLGDDKGSSPDAPAGKSRQAKGDASKGGRSAKGGHKDEPKVKSKPIDIEVEALAATQICLVTGGEALIDSQVLGAGAVESFGGQKRFRLDFQSAGEVKLTAGGNSERLESGGETTYEADSEGIREIEYAGPDCP